MATDKPLRPQQFSESQDDAMKWLRKFKEYVGSTKAQDTNAIHCFYMLLGRGP